MSKKIKAHLEAVLIGNASEPKANPLDGSKMELVKLLNWYAANKKADDSKKWLIKFVGNEKASRIEKLHPTWFGNVGFVARILERGFAETPERARAIDYINSEVARLEGIYASQVTELKAVEAAKADRKAMQDRQKAEALAAKCSVVDHLLDIVYMKPRSTIAVIQAELDTLTLDEKKAVIETAKQKMERLSQDAYDEEAVKAYKIGYLIKAAQVLRALISSLEDVVKVEKAKKVVVRKPRARKPIDKAKLVSGLKYAKAHPVIGDSLTPIKLLDTKEAFVFDGRNLRFYKAKAGQTLSVKGTTLINFDETESKAKVIRKQDTLAGFRNMTVPQRRKFFASIKAVEKAVTGRFNDECVIVSVN